MILIWTTKIPKCMANASFYKPKFGTIDFMTNCWVDGQLLTWWKSLSSCLNKRSLLTLELELTVLMKVIENYLIFPVKKLGSFRLLELKIWVEHWTVSGLQDSFRLLRCSYNLDFKTAFLNLGFLMKVVGLCLIYPSV